MIATRSAWHIPRYGRPETLIPVRLPIPQPGPTVVLIRIRASAVTRADGMMRKGEPLFARPFLGLRRPRNGLAGTGLSGEVIAVGANVRRFAPGEMVFGEAGMRFGANASHICLDEDGVLMPKPEALSHEDAAVLCDGVLTSWHFLRNLGQVQSGDRVLILGEAGSLGSAALQITDAMGAEVTATCGARNADLVTSLGATFAAQTERATQDMLRRALALGDRTPVAEPLREMARHLGVTLDETRDDWRALAFEGLRVMLDVSRERERREVGTYEDVTPIFRSVMASRADAPAAGVPAAPPPAPAPAVPTASAPASLSPAVGTGPAATAPAEPEVATSLQGPIAPSAAPTTEANTQPAAAEATAPACGSASSHVAAGDDETAFRIRMRPPLLRNIDLRDLSDETRKVLRTKPRGITLLEGITLMKELKIAGYGDDFSVEQTGDADAGRKWTSDSGSKANVAEKLWVEFVGDVPFEDADQDDIRDALKILPELPYQHSKGKDRFVARNGFRALVDDLDDEEERAEKDASTRAV